MSDVRVRIAPAPSGFLHVGSVRTALYNWLHARQHDGVFLLRIEDTDEARATDESVTRMLEAMEWVGLDWDEGPGVGGPVGPYRQSERRDLYAAVARRLEEAGHLYRDERTQDEVEVWRRERQQKDLPPIVKADEVPDATGRGPASLRLRTPTEGSVTVTDLVRGDITWEWSTISDPVLVRSDGSATYPLANSVDDVAQGITLVCRGEDLLSVTPRQVLLYDRLTADGLLDAALKEVGLPGRRSGWTPPREFAHLSMIVGEDRKPLSKRHGSVAIQEFARQGFLPEVLLNYLALLGWSHPSGEERLSVEEMVASFSLSSVNKTAAAFDIDKLTAFNGERIRGLDPDDLAAQLVPFLDGTFPPDDEDWDALVASPPSEEERATVRALVPLVQERMQRLDEVQRYAPPFLLDDIELDPVAVRKVLSRDSAPAVLAAAHRALSDVEAWEPDELEAVLRPLGDELDIGFGKVAQPVRVAVTGTSVSPPLFGTLAVMEREVVLERIDAARPVAEKAVTES